jgi:ABC-type phosphate/phosphonate transport system permease subunit
MKMIEKIYYFILCKMSDLFPPAGGMVGAVSQTKQFEFLPTWEAILSTVIIAVVGGAVGYIVKLLFDIIFNPLKEKYKLK